LYTTAAAAPATAALSSLTLNEHVPRWISAILPEASAGQRVACQSVSVDLRDVEDWRHRI
jgi:hypothetical protein